MVVLENVCGKSLAWESEMWFASLDLQKTFDRIEHESLFQALQAQGIPDTYLQVFRRRLYANQSGNVGGCMRLPFCFQNHTWGETRECFKPRAVQFWDGARHAKLQTTFEVCNFCLRYKRLRI